MRICIFLINVLFFIENTQPEETATTKSVKVDIRQILKDERVIPLVIDDIPENVEICEVFYQNKSIIPGEFLPGPRTTIPPNVTWKADNDSLYLLYFSGSTRWLPFQSTLQQYEQDIFPQEIEWENWVVINIPGCNVSAGDLLADYVCPGYPIRVEMREKFTFFVYKQPCKYDYYKLTDNLEKAFPEEITLRNFVQMYNLTEPVAVNFFHTKWDEAFQQTMSSLRWAYLVHYNGSTKTSPLTVNYSDWPTLDVDAIRRKFGWENFTISPDLAR